jgi:purine-nucleoside phosphorylase
MVHDNLQGALRFIRMFTDFEPEVGIVLGTGLSQLAEEMEIAYEIPYSEIPHFPVSTVQSHASKLVFGTIAGRKVAALAGRFHYYEGYSMQEVTFPIRVLKFLGIDRILISNAAGSVNADIEAGDLVFVRDHINLQPDNPLRGKNDDRLGPRFPDMLHTYDRDLIKTALELAQKANIRAHSGVYAALPGPNLETPAEYEFLHRIGADLVGMSTVPEVLVAKHMGLKVFVVSVVSNKCYPLEEIRETTVDDVIAVVEKAAPAMQEIVRALLPKW